MTTREDIIKFARNEDYAFLAGAGFTAANDQDVRESVAKSIEDAWEMRELKTEQVEDNASELLDEVANGCTVYLFLGHNYQLYIAYYEI